MDEEVEGVYLPFSPAMIWACAFGHVHRDVCLSPNVREVSYNITFSGVVFAAHWAGHHYTRQCIFETPELKGLYHH